MLLPHMCVHIRKGYVFFLWQAGSWEIAADGMENSFKTTFGASITHYTIVHTDDGWLVLVTRQSSYKNVTFNFLSFAFRTTAFFWPIIRENFIIFIYFKGFLNWLPCLKRCIALFQDPSHSAFLRPPAPPLPMWRRGGNWTTAPMGQPPDYMLTQQPCDQTVINTKLPCIRNIQWNLR